MDENVRRTMTNADLKLCNGCKEWQSKGKFNKDKTAKDGLSYRCVYCRAKHRRDEEVKQRTSTYNKKYVKENPDIIKKISKRHSLRRFWNMSVEEYESMLIKQNGTCALCNKTESNPHKRLCIDHDHQTGKIRGLLCDNHNRAMGLFKDDIEILEKAIVYLKSHRN